MIRAIVCGWKECYQWQERCSDSISMQRYDDYDVTWEIVPVYPRRYLVESTVVAVQKAGPELEDVLAFIDADDFLTDDDAFGIIAEAYERDPQLLLTHGNYVNYSTSERGKFRGAYTPQEDVRTAAWRASHLKTMKYKLWTHIPNTCFRDKGGEYYRCCADRAMMIPAMEIAGLERCKYIDTVLYCYNDTNPLGVWKTMKDMSRRIREEISRRPKLDRVEI